MYEFVRYRNQNDIGPISLPDPIHSTNSSNSTSQHITAQFHFFLLFFFKHFILYDSNSMLQIVVDSSMLVKFLFNPFCKFVVFNFFFCSFNFHASFSLHTFNSKNCFVNEMENYASFYLLKSRKIK